jgi:hypothetical protein
MYVNGLSQHNTRTFLIFVIFIHIKIVFDVSTKEILCRANIKCEIRCKKDCSENIWEINFLKLNMEPYLLKY